MKRFQFFPLNSSLELRTSGFRGVTFSALPRLWGMNRKQMLFFTLFVAIATAVHAGPRSFHVDVKGSGRPMILIPGLSSPGAVWDGTIAHFEKTYECHSLTLAGFAGRKAIDAPLLPTVRKELVEYIRSNKLDKPILVGHSLGGFLAFWLASSEPGLVGAVIAVDGLPFAPAMMGAPLAPEQIEQMQRYVASQTPEQFELQTRMSLGMMITKKEDIERIAAASVKSDPATVGRAMKEKMTTDLRDAVSKIDVPVLLIGAGDAKDAYEKQVASIPRHETVMAKDAKHFVMLDAPDFFLATLDRFLGGLK
jgi:N-formylmaleamate deformylase